MRRRRDRRSDRGAAVVDFVLVLVVLIPILLGIIQVALVLYVRNTLAAAAAEGARYAATADASTAQGAALARRQIADVTSSRYADDVTVRRVVFDGVAAVEVVVHARVPALGIGGPSVELEVSGHAVEEDP